jgi:hypothetical protein
MFQFATFLAIGFCPSAPNCNQMQRFATVGFDLEKRTQIDMARIGAV